MLISLCFCYRLQNTVRLVQERRLAYRWVSHVYTTSYAKYSKYFIANIAKSAALITWFLYFAFVGELGERRESCLWLYINNQLWRRFSECPPEGGRGLLIALS